MGKGGKEVERHTLARMERRGMSLYINPRSETKEPSASAMKWISNQMVQYVSLEDVGSRLTCPSRSQILLPRTHHKCIVDRHDEDVADSSSLEFLVVVDVSRRVRITVGCERSGYADLKRTSMSKLKRDK